MHQYSGCGVNSVQVVTRRCNNCHKSQNSRVVVEGDQNEENNDFFGYLTNIFELSCINGSKVVLFNCDGIMLVINLKYILMHMSRAFTLGVDGMKRIPLSCKSGKSSVLL